MNNPIFFNESEKKLMSIYLSTNTATPPRGDYV